MKIRVCLLGVLLILLSQPAFSQSFQEACTGATLDDMSILPISDSTVSGGDADFTVEASCLAAGPDVVPANFSTVSWALSAG